MCVFKNGAFYHYEFTLDGRRHRGSTGTADRDEAVREESRQRERLEKSYGQVIEEEARQQRRKTIQEAADEFLVEYTAKHESSTFAVYALGHVTDHMGKKLVVEITPTVVKGYQTARLAEQAGPKSINNEVLLLLRLCGDQGELIRSRLKRAKALKLKVGPSPGKPFSVEEQDRLLDRARQSTEAARLACERQARGEKPSKGQKQGGPPSIYPALVLALNCGMRDSEIKNLRWSQIDWGKGILTVGKSKTEAGAGRTIPLNGAVLKALVETLKQHPIFNSSLDEAASEIVIKEYFHIGIAVDTEQGLIVPVIRDVDKKSMLELVKELEQLAQKARDRKVTAEELKGGTFTISNQGAIGGAHFTPIVNKPQVAILGLGRGAMKPVVRDGKIVMRLMTPLGLSYDHRVIDGGEAARFVTDLVHEMENFSANGIKL